MFNRLFTFFSICVLLISCTNSNDDFYKSDRLEKNIEIKKVDEFTLHSADDSEKLIGNLRFSFASNPAGSLHAFYDEIKKQFLITDNKGEIQEVIGDEGRGPKEIVGVEGYNFNNKNQLVVYDNTQLMIKVYDLDGEILSHAKPEQSSYPISGSKLHTYDGNLVSGTMDRRLLGNLKDQAYKSKLAAVHNYDGQLLDTIGTYDPSLRKPTSYNLFPIVTVDKKSGHLISTHYHNYRIQVYDLATEQREAWFGRKTEGFTTGEEYVSMNLPRHKIKEKTVGRSSAVSIHTVPNYIVLYFETITEAFYETGNSNKKKSYLAVYNDESYDSYGDVRLPYVLGNVSNGKFYLIENDNPSNYTVGIYEFNKKN